jgi:tetratricopeptide (TPR) repeat protein
MVFSILPEFTLVVDAIDECSGPEPIHLLGKLNTLSQSSNGRVVLFSRQSSTFAKHLHLAISIQMGQEVVGSEVLLFTEREIDRTEEFRELKTKILQRLDVESSGLFLWVTMMLKYLKNTPTRKLQEQRLRDFPPSLADIYERFLIDAATSLRKDELAIRKEIFTILIGAHRPLNVDEISSMLATRISPDYDTGDTLITPKETIRTLCWPLVDVSQNQVQIIHASVREFLTNGSSENPKSVRVQVSDSKDYMAKVCLNELRRSKNVPWHVAVSLLKHNIHGGTIEGIASFQQHTHDCLYDYVATHWHSHIMTGDWRLTAGSASQLGAWMDSEAFILWVEYLCHVKGLPDLGPILSVKAEMKSWCISLPEKLRKNIPLTSFLVRPYETACERAKKDRVDAILPSIFLYRIAYFLNLESNESEKVFTMRKSIMKEASKYLGEQHPFSLRCAADFAIEQIISFNYDEAETLLSRILELQRQAVDPNAFDAFYTISYIALCKYYQLELEESVALQEVAAAGLVHALGTTNRNALKSKLYLGWALEAQGNFSGALQIYRDVLAVWTTLQPMDNPLTMMAQSCLSMVERKQGNNKDALIHGDEAFVNRQRIMGDQNTITFDSALNLVFIYRNMEDYGQAKAMLDLARSMGAAHQAKVRLCQLDRLDACIKADQNEVSEAIQMLSGMIQEASRLNADPNRELLSARLDLADLLRKTGKSGEVLELFKGLVEPKKGKQKDETIDMNVVEQAARCLIYDKDLRRAQTLLDMIGCKWNNSRYYWIPAGGPYVGV